VPKFLGALGPSAQRLGVPQNRGSILGQVVDFGAGGSILCGGCGGPEGQSMAAARTEFWPIRRLAHFSISRFLNS
jgi:hypothetical protein